MRYKLDNQMEIKYVNNNISLNINFGSIRKAKKELKKRQNDKTKVSVTLNQTRIHSSILIVNYKVCFKTLDGRLFVSRINKLWRKHNV